ncbi:AAEL012471-PA [Aedes aegypti]|uniref:AAEL012471-PA n=1 Tax=Aedes aegypti TaxID=7159 RepID=Q16LZ7_AEDAE|nr:AAEL012471-PA [Aedes aegypti]
MVQRQVLLYLTLQCCIYSILGLGWVLPEKPIVRLVNQSYDITCTLNRSDPDTEKFTSNDLMFYIMNDTTTQHKHMQHEHMQREHVKIVNETTIQLSVHNASAGKFQCICKLNHTKGVGMRSVYVGYKPYNVTNFKCRSENWQNMNCSFIQKQNPIPTDYKLNFKFDRETSFVDYNCPLEGKSDSWSCLIDLESSYRQSYEFYYFVLVSNNTLGRNVEYFTINNYDNVIPEAPMVCQATNITSKSAILHWAISYKLQTFKRDFIFQIKILSSFDNSIWKPISITNIAKSLTNYTLPIEDLEFADTTYDVRIRMQTATAENTEEMWSNYSSCLFKTLPRRPDNPPEVVIGGFEINAYNDIFVYWREIPRSKHNSATGFRYKISEITRNGIPISNITEGRNGSSMIQFRNMTDGNYTFVIRSSNSEGDSLGASHLFIPARRYRAPKPEITKLLSDAGKYLLSWKLVPDYASRITSYTVFWCNSSSNSPNDCNGSINFDEIDNTRDSYELNNVSSTLNFAVAANAGNLSSGMVWASCTATQKNDIGKLKTIWIPAMQSTYIDLEWKLECGDSAIVEGYSIIYCPISSPRDQSCKVPEESLNITGTTSHRITGLKPYVTYKIQIAMYSKTRIGPRSDPLFNTTLEDAPSPPRNLMLKDVRNDSVILHWDPPLQINGGKMNYEVWYNHQHKKIDPENYTDHVTYNLTGLEPFTNYKIIVRAYTIAYSNNSNSVDVTTEIGTPGIMQQPGSVDSNSTRLSIIWQPPEKKAGCMEYYELKIKTNTQTEESAIIMRVSGTRCTLKRTICLGSADSNRTDKYEFSVRAVNVILSPHAPNYTEWNRLACDQKYSYYLNHGVPNTYNYHSHPSGLECELNGHSVPFIDWMKIDQYATILHGEWSWPLTHWCNYGPSNTEAIIFLSFVTCLGIISLLICTYMSLKKMKQIKNIKVVLPDALNDIVASDKPDVFKESNDSYVNGYSDKNAGDTLLSYSPSHRYVKNNLDDSTSIGSNDENIDNDDGVVDGEVDLLSLSDDGKSQQYLPMEQDLCQPSEPINTDIIDIRSNVNKDNVLSLPSTGYVLAPVAKPSTNGYVQAPLAKPAVTSNYIQPSAFTGINNPSLSKTSIIVSTTDADGISGYVTHKQLSDYGLKMQ